MSTTSSNHTVSNRLIGRGTILILSGYLIGFASSRFIHPDIRTSVLLTGVGGVITFFGLSVIGERRRERKANVANQLATKKLERRLDRHDPRKSQATPTRKKRSLSEIDEQYLPVVQSSRIPRR